MARNTYFQFKEFTIQQEKAAMKVGIDGTLLGGWVTTENAKRILDLGTGTGLIALMLAQRTDALITAIEIEENAALQAGQNAANSPWENRVEVEHVSFQQFTKNSTNTFDLIVSNPPFFSNSFKAKGNERTMARHNDSLPFSELISCSNKLLSPHGNLAVILPVEQARELIDLALGAKLHLNRLTHVFPNKSKPCHRYLMEFSKLETKLNESDFYIENVGSREYTDQYKSLLKAYYLLF